MSKIIVTLTDPISAFNMDIEVPTEQKMATLKYDIIEAINGYDFSLRLDPETIDFFCDRIDQILELEDTCESLGIWNGDYLIIQRKR